MPPSDSDSDPGWNEALIAVCKKRGKTTTISEEDRIKQIQECLDEDADIDTMDGNGNTALHTAVKRGYQMVAKFLRKAGARTDIPNRNGQTAISLARDLGEQEIMCTLNEPSTSRNTDPSSHNTLLNPSLNSTIRKRTAAAQDSSFDGSLSKMRLISTSQADPQRDVVSDEQRSNRERTADDELVQPTKRQRKMTLTAEKETYGASGINRALHGTVYQSEVLMLIVHRARQLNYMFRLATEMDAAEKFDDVVLRYKDSNGDEMYRFLQAKHKQDEDEEISGKDLSDIRNGDFSLLKYFISWRKIKRNPIFAERVSKDFILFTNIGLKMEDFEKRGIIVVAETKPDKLLDLTNVRNKKKPQRYKLLLQNSSCLWKTLKSRSGGEVTDCEISHFLDEFILAVNQPNEIELGEIIERNIGAEFNRVDAGIVRDLFQIEIMNWLKSRNGTFLTNADADDFFDKMRGEVDAIKTAGVSMVYTRKLEELGIRFNDVNTKILNFIDRRNNGSKQLLKIISTKQTLLTALQVFQILAERQKLYKNEIVTFVRLKTLSGKEISQLVLGGLNGPANRNLLIIDCESTNAKQQLQLLAPIYEIMAENADSKTILITQVDEDLGSECHVDCETCRVYSTEYSFDNLTQESQKKLLGKRVTEFQGTTNSTNFAELLGIPDWDNLGEDDVKDLSRMMDTDSLVELISKDELQIGRGLDGLEDVGDYYVNRTILRHVVIREDILKDTEIPDSIAISGIDEVLPGEMMRKEATPDANDTLGVSSIERCISDELLRIGGPSLTAQGPTNFVILARNREKKQFTALCMKNKYRNVHWLKKERGKYIWKKSQGNISHLVQHRDDRERVDINERTGVTHLNENQLTAHNEPVIISDTAGTGKSTMLTHLASEMKENNPDMLVLKINLSYHTRALAEESRSGSYDLRSIDGAIQFLLKELLSDEFNFSRKVFEIMIKRKHKVTLIFDGFDEISPTYEKTVIDLLRTLADYGIRKLLVATRPVTTKLLEAKLNAFSYEIQPFSTYDQERFLASFWKTKFEDSHSDLNPTAEVCIGKYTTAIMKTLADSIKDQRNKFTANPLQAKLVAEVFERNNERMRGNFDSCKDFIDSEADEPKFPEKINLTYLYEHFVEKKFEIFFTKRGGNLFDPRVLADKEQSRKSYIAKHERLALYTLFDKDKIEELSFSKRNSSYRSPGSTDVEDYIEREGIITRSIDGQPRFLDRTYAEYFAAKFFSKVLKKREPDESFGKIFVAHVLLEDKYETMRAFINWLLSDEYHDVEYSDSEFWTRLVKENRSQREETIFHLAAAEGNDHIIRMFLNCFGVNKEDLKVIIHLRDFAGKTAVHRAVEYGNLENTKLLVEDTGYEINCRDANGSTALHQAAHMGAFDVVRYFIDKGADVDFRTNVYLRLLYMAARKGEVSIVDYLLEKVADVNFLISYSTKLVYGAAMGGQLEMVKYFLEKGANISSGIGVVWMPLNVAALVGQVDIVDYLLEKGADVNSSTNNGETPLYTAALSGQLETVKYLLEKKANINSRTDDGSTPLHAAACRGRLSIVDYLLEKGADVNSSTNNGETPLYTAAECGKLEMVKYLVEKRANIDSRTNDGSTLLHAAAYGGELDIADCFLDMGADVDSPTNDGETPLYTAAESGKLQMVKYLLEKGANIDSKSNEGWTALDVATDMGRNDIVKCLLEMEASGDSLPTEG